MSNKAVFLDRDGVINEEPLSYNFTKEHFKWIKGSKEALKLLRKTDFKLVVVSNQSRIGKGIVKKEHVDEINDIFRNMVDGVYYCPHIVDDGCECRKPEIGMLLEAGKKYNIDFSKSFFVGDRTIDILTGNKVGCTTILLKTGYAGNEYKGYDVKPDYVAEDLLDAVKNVILKT